MTQHGHAGWMARALNLAERGRATCRPNPMVGCVLVRDGRVIGQGWHERPGGPHAEVAALHDAGDARGATAYVTLEPCSHHGRTGPCTVALRDAGVVEVVYAVDDPNPEAAGGASALRQAGVLVAGGVLGEWAAAQNDVFFHGISTRLPHVTLKVAQTVDGQLVAPHGRWVTGPVARTQVHRMRALVDAVLVGAGTVVADDPELTVRDVPVPGQDPRAVVLDSHGRIPTDAKVLRPGTIVITGPLPNAGWRQEAATRGAEVVPVALSDDRIDLMAAMAELWEREVRAILAEPGAMLATALTADGLVQRLVTHVANASLTDELPFTNAIPVTAGWPTRRIVPRGPDLEIEQQPPPGGT